MRLLDCTYCDIDFHAMAWILNRLDYLHDLPYKEELEPNEPNLMSAELAHKANTDAITLARQIRLVKEALAVPVKEG